MSGRLVHGLDGDEVPADWPPLTLPEVAPVLAEFGLTAVAITWHSPRPLSSAALVATTGRTVFVKRHNATVRTPAGLAEEHGFSAHLRSYGLPVPRVLSTERSGRAVLRDGWTWEVHERGEGRDLYRETQSWQPFSSVTHAIEAGRVLGRLASAGEAYDAPPRRPQPLVGSWTAIRRPDLQAGLEDFVAARPSLAAFVAGRDWRGACDEALGPLHGRLRPYLDELPPGWTHGDGHASNLLWHQGGEVASVLDLGLADRTTPLFDLATAIERNAVAWLHPEPTARRDLVEGLVCGWVDARGLTELEAEALPALLPLAHVEFALSEVDYYAGATGSPANAEVAWSGYLLGHARWFTRPHGIELLDQLRALGERYAGAAGTVVQ
jgi:Ser/Thr protein kinase RdoA (MazF antagonist)